MKQIRIALGLLLVSASLNSCIKQSFDNPPDTTSLDPNLPCNVTVAQLNNMALNMGTGAFRFMGDSTLYGIVTADDRSGNIYKQLIIQDSTGGIAVGIDASNLYVDYPVGRKVYVKLNGVILANYHGLPELTGSVAAGGKFTGITSAAMFTTVIKASYPHEVVAKKARMSDVFSNPAPYLNTLVELQNMEFATGSYGLPYASSISSGSTGTNRTIQDCPTTGTLVVYNSAYANFQPYTIPSGKGTITGIFSMYTTPQFLLRDTTDIKLTQPRDCQ
jgi:hypothetical protein